MNDKELSLVEKIYERHSEMAFSEILEVSVFSREPTFRHLQSLVRQGIIKKRQIGNLFLYSINYGNPQTSSVLSIIINNQLKSMDIMNIADDLSQKLMSSPILFSLITPIIQPKRKKISSFDIMIVYTGDKDNVSQEIIKIEKQIQYTSKLKISFSLYNTDEFISKLRENKHFLSGRIPFFNPERLFMILRYKIYNKDND